MLKGFLSGIVSLFRAELPHDERRKVIRARCRYAVYCVDVKEVSQAKVTDMGTLGLRMRGSKKYREGDFVRLVYRGVAGQRLSSVSWERLQHVEDAVRCRVTWSRKKRHSKIVETGLVYDDTDDNFEKGWVKMILRELGFGPNTLQRRGKIRVKSWLPAEARGTELKIQGHVIDLGVGGAQFQCAEQIKEGTEIRLSLGPHKRKAPLKLRGQVVSQTFDVPSNTCRHGVRWLDVGGEELKLLGRYVVDLLKESSPS